MQQLAFFSISGSALDAFRRLKTESEMAFHGPLSKGQEVPTHTHQEAALYLVEVGKARFVDGVELELGKNTALNAVLVPAGKPHGWVALSEGETTIVHVFGKEAIDQVIA